MIKILGTAVVAVAMLAASPAFAGGKACCAKNASNQAACADLASLNLTADQKTKMDAVVAEHQKAGCSEASEAKYMKEAKTILDKDQFAKFKAECKGDKDKAKTET